ncbi:hypothetical protein [Pedobacter sp. GR22-10]|uniref:hypothetical protein n=1 Tax=Pedobacter sp. GR22-10 TaxID=2994472 RepID=UPI0022470C58|nr:hypothetical protein [Pedobacter sp. GR22-10]MCX2429928.1 hypothetical protein [Pedobacter sp. GR22-10]
MEKGNILSDFLDKISDDPRICIAHLGLFAVLFKKWSEQGGEGVLKIFAAQAMVHAKISSSNTYHRLIRELDEYGYLRYEPSFYKRKASQVHFIFGDINKENIGLLEFKSK